MSANHTCSGGHVFAILNGVPVRVCPVDGVYANAWDWWFWLKMMLEMAPQP